VGVAVMMGVMLLHCRPGPGTSGQIVLSGLCTHASAKAELSAVFSGTPWLVTDRVDQVFTSAHYYVGGHERTYHCVFHPLGIRSAMYLFK
jgi:hypothetical protein